MYLSFSLSFRRAARIAVLLVLAAAGCAGRDGATVTGASEDAGPGSRPPGSGDDAGVDPTPPSDAASADAAAPDPVADASADASADAGPLPHPACLLPSTSRATASIVEVPYGVGQVKYVVTESTTSPAGPGGVDVRLALCRPGIAAPLVLVTITPDTTAPFTWVFGPVSPSPGTTQAALVYGPAFDKVWITETFTR